MLKKILFLTKEYHHSNISSSGGTGVFYKNLAEELSKRGYQVWVFGSAKKAIDFQENGIKFHFVKDFFRKNKSKEFFRSIFGKFNFSIPWHNQLYVQEKKYIVDELQKYLTSEKITPDIIETHDWDGISLFLTQTKIPYTVRFHGSWTVLEKVFGYKNVPPGKKHCEQLALEKSKHNIVISKISKTINEGIFHISNPQLIYNGIDSHIFSNNEKNSKIENSIFYFGNLSKEKGVETALEAFNRIKKDVPNCTLHFVGKTNDYQSKLIDFLPKDVLKDVFFYGNQSFSEIVNLLSKAAVVFFPSKGENFSLALLESLSLSKIVICSDIPAFSEIVKHGENGFIAKDIEDFHAITLKIFQSSTEQISTIENNARNTVVENFDISKMTDNTIQYYQTIISEII